MAINIVFDVETPNRANDRIYCIALFALYFMGELVQCQAGAVSISLIESKIQLSSGHRTQQIDIYYRFDVAVSTAVADSMKYDKKRKVA